MGPGRLFVKDLQKHPARWEPVAFVAYLSGALPGFPRQATALVPSLVDSGRSSDGP